MLGVNDNDIAVTHERADVDCGACPCFGIVCPGRRCLDRWRQQHAPGLEQVRNSVDARERSESAEIRDFIVDEKIDVSPLVVGDKLYVFTMTNTAYIFDVNTGAQLARRQLAAPFDPTDDRQPTVAAKWTNGQHVPQLGSHGDSSD